MSLPIPHYLVLDENTLGYVYDERPDSFNMLHGSVLRGSIHDWRHGSTYVPQDKTRLRPATGKDFDDYLICRPPEFRDSVPVSV